VLALATLILLGPAGARAPQPRGLERGAQPRSELRQPGAGSLPLARLTDNSQGFQSAPGDSRGSSWVAELAERPSPRPAAVFLLPRHDPAPPGCASGAPPFQPRGPPGRFAPGIV